MRSALVPILLADPMPWAFKAPYAWDFLRDRARFAGGYKGALSNTPGWSFTRASTGYAQTTAGVLTPFASGELRRTDKGVLIEGARTNLLTYSQQMDDASWTKARSSCSADAAVAPDGTTTADSITEDGTAGNTHAVQRSGITVTATALTLSIYAKDITRRYLSLRVNDNASNANAGAAVFDLQSGVISTAATAYGTFSAASATITALANGWYRLALTVTSSATSVSAKYELNNGSALTADGQSSYNGNGTSALYVFGAQLEQASFPSSYIPTTTASATRAADSLSITGVTGLEYPLSLFAEFERAVDTGGGEALFTVHNGSTTDEAYLLVDSSDRGSCNARAASSIEMSSSATGALAVASAHKAAARIAANNGIVARGGVLSALDSALTVPATPAGISFGGRYAANTPSFGYLRRAAIWNRALSDAELQAVTPA